MKTKEKWMRIFDLGHCEMLREKHLDYLLGIVEIVKKKAEKERFFFHIYFISVFLVDFKSNQSIIKGRKLRPQS